MQKTLVIRKISGFIQPLTRVLLITLISLFLIAGVWYLRSSNISSKLSKGAGLEPTPTAPLPPVARIQNLLINSNSQIDGVWAGQDLPEIIIETYTIYQGGKVSGEGFEQVLKFIQILADLDLAVRQVSIYNEGYSELLLQDGVVVLYSSSKDPKTSAYTLQEMYAIFSIEGELPEKIDLRFRKPATIN